MELYRSHVEEIVDALMDAVNYHEEIHYTKIPKMNKSILSQLDTIVISELRPLLDKVPIKELPNHISIIHLLTREICNEFFARR
jgi:hypothetical protein